MKMESATNRGFMVRLEDLIADLQKIHASFGNTCVYIRGSVSWGAVAMNRRDEDTQLDKLDVSKTIDGAPEEV